MKRTCMIAGLMVAVLTASAWAATPGNVALDPFDLGTSAEISAMGGASAAAPGGLWSLAYNPAGLADIKGRQVGASYVKWIEESSVGYGAVALPPGFAAGVVGFDQGSITTSSGFFPGTTEKVNDFGAVIGYGVHLPVSLSNVSVGLSTQFWQKNLASVKASTFALNLGGRVSLLDNQVSIGAFVQNLGPSLKFETSEEDKQPLTFAIGGGYLMRKQPRLPVQVGVLADVLKPTQQDVIIGGGGQVILQDILALRLGANTGGDKTQITYGAGVAYKGFGIDYAFGNVTLLGEDIAIHRVSVNFGLGGGE